jgi:hypothetical protein
MNIAASNWEFPATAYLLAARWYDLLVPVWSKWTQRRGVDARDFRIALPSDTISIPAGMVCYYQNATGLDR